MYSHFTFLSVCHLMTCYDDRFGSSHKRSDCRHLLLFHGIQLLTAVSIFMSSQRSPSKCPALGSWELATMAMVSEESGA